MANESLPDWKNELQLFAKHFTVEKFYILGGEPLLNPYAEDIIYESFKFSDKVQLITNGISLKSNLWLQKLVLENNNFEIYISYHQSKELIGKTKYDEIFISNISELLNISESAIIKKIQAFKDVSLPKGISLIPNVYLGLTYQDWRFPKLDNNDIPLPYNSNYVNAKMNACHCPVPHLYKNKIYKCHVTALLPDLLEKHGKYDDNWHALKDYEPVSLKMENIIEYKNLYTPEPVCSICPESIDEFEKGNKRDKYNKIINLVLDN